MWSEGRYQFLPFLITVLAIVFTDLLIGVLIGLATSLGFILYSNFKRPLRRYIEKHLGGDVLHIELANQVSFLNRAALSKVLNEVPVGGHVLIDASATDYIDPDVLDLLRDYAQHTAPARGVQVSRRGFRQKYNFEDHIQYIDYSTRELQSKLTPAEVLKILQEGHKRFRSGRRLTRDFDRLVSATADGQHPLAAVLSCIDSRAPVEVVFDLAVGDVFGVRVAGNVISPRVLGSLEYAVAVAGARLILVLGHTRCGAVTAAVNQEESGLSVAESTGCDHLEPILDDIQLSITDELRSVLRNSDPIERESLVNLVALHNVGHSMQSILRQSRVISRLVESGQIGLVGGLYDVVSGDIVFHDVGDLVKQV
jgi:carbonic anhydrase/SulP family sulfate permease